MGVDDLSSSSVRQNGDCVHGRRAKAVDQINHTTIARQRQETEFAKYANAVPAPYREVIDLTQDSPSRKRKRQEVTSCDQARGLPQEAAPMPSTSSQQEPKKKKGKQEEKRLRRWRKTAPSSYLEIRQRALTQRMFALDRKREHHDTECPSEVVTLAGTTGNVYTVMIDKVPSCNCPHALKGNQCKHICYVLTRILRVRADLEYQLAFTTAELCEIFENAPPLPSEASRNTDGHRKPIEGECPICMVDLEPESGESIVYCQSACGNNIHKSCFDQWAASKRGSTVTCPFCRAPWESSAQELQKLTGSGAVNDEGYLNVANQLGISGRRDYSSYHSFWVRGQVRRGEISWDDDGVMDHDIDEY